MSGIYADLNLNNLYLFPENWRQQIAETTEQLARQVFLDGSDASSREPPETAGINYGVVDGEQIKRNLPWLDKLYSALFLIIAENSSGRGLKCSPEKISAININEVFGLGGRYEWHVDRNPITGLLFVDDFSEEEGGELVFRMKSGPISIAPTAGRFLVFDAREVPHAVMPLKVNRSRKSVPMNFFHIDDTDDVLDTANVSSYILS